VNRLTENVACGFRETQQTFRLEVAFEKINTSSVLGVEGNIMTERCRNCIEGRFVKEFTMSPAGPLPPNGARVTRDLINIFRFNEKGRLVEEFVRTDYRSFLRQLGAQGR